MEARETSPQLFLSYARADAHLVTQLSDAIRAQGWSTWVDRVSIPSASEWMAEIRRGIESTDGFVFVITPHSLASRMCRVELSIAVDLSKRLLPLWALTKADWEVAEKRIREEGGTEAVGQVPPELSKLQYIDINKFSNRINPLQELVKDLLSTASHDLVWLRQHTGLQRDVKRWVEERYSSAALLRGVLLAEAEAMLLVTDKDPPLTALQREFVEASRAEYQKSLEREAAQLAHRVLDLPSERIALGVMLSLEGLATYLQTPQLIGALRTLLSRWPQRTLILHDDYVTSAVFSSDDRVALTSSADGFLRLVDVRTGAIVRHTRGWGVPISSAALRPDGKVAAAGYQDGCVRIFDLDRGECTEVRLSEAGIDHVAISPAGSKIFAVAGAQPFVIDLASGRDYRLPGHSDSITSATFYADARVVTTSKDGQVRTFDLASQQWEEFGLSSAAINTACVSPDGKWMAISGSFDGVFLVDTKTRGILRRLDVPGGSGLLMALSKDGARLAVSDIWGRVSVFNPQSGEVVANKKMFPAHAWSLAMSADGSLFCGGSRSGSTLVCDTAKGGEWLCAGHDGPVRTVTFDSTGTLLLTGGADKTARIFAISRIPRTLTVPHVDTVLTAEVSPDGMLLATTARDGVTRTFDTRTGSLLVEFRRSAGNLLSASFTPPGDLVVAFKEGTIAFVNARSGAVLRSFESVPVDDNSEVRMTRDQRRLVTVQFREIVRVLSPDDGATVEVDEEERTRILLDIEEQMGLISPRGRLVHPGRGQPPVLERDRTRIYLKTREYQVIDAAISPDGSVVVGAALNRSELPLFDSADCDFIAALRLQHPSNAARFSTDGSCIVARWLNAVSVVKYPATSRLLELARNQVYRKLTALERSEFGLPAEAEDPVRENPEQAADPAR